MSLRDLFNIGGNHRQKPKHKKLPPVGFKLYNTGWHKNLSQSERRRATLKAHKGDALSSARAMQRLANITNDRQTAIKARQDATYFYNLNRNK